MGIFVLTPPQTGAGGESTVPIYTGDVNNVYYGMYVVLSQIQSSLSNISSSLGTVATNSTSVKSSLQTIENSVNVGSTTLVSVLSDVESALDGMKTILADIESHQQKIKELAEGTGIHTIGPLEYVGFISTYRRLIEEGGILRWREFEPTEKDISKALNDLGKYVDKIQKNIPRAF